MRKWTDIIVDLKEELDISNVQTRKVGNTVIPYLEGATTIETANRIFGHDGWSTFPIGPVERFDVGTITKNGKEVVVYTYTVPVRCEFHGLLDDGTVHTIIKGDIGKNSTQSEAFQQAEMAISGCATDALKRSMRHLGNQFGLTLYDKESEDFKAAINGGTNRKSRSQKRSGTRKRKSKKSKSKKTSTTRKSKKSSTESSGSTDVSQVAFERALQYKLPESVMVDDQEVILPESGKTLEEIMDAPMAIIIFGWLAGLRESPNNLSPFQPHTQEEAQLHYAIRYVLSHHEPLMEMLTDEELEELRKDYA